MQRTVICKNHSAYSGSFCIFQKAIDQPSNQWSLVWQCKYCHPGVAMKFEWEDTPYFVWGEYDMNTSMYEQEFFPYEQQKVELDEEHRGSIGLSYKDTGLLFSKTQYMPNPNHLAVYTDQSIPTNGIVAGIGMMGKRSCNVAAIISAAVPNTGMSFATDMEYGITFGSYQLGQVINFSNLPTYTVFSFTDPYAELEIELTADNKWHISMT